MHGVFLLPGTCTRSSVFSLPALLAPLSPLSLPAQATLETAYKAELRDAFGIEFSRLLALNNMPIKRFADWLLRRGQLDEYMSLLARSFNPRTVGGLMCRDTISVRWDGALFDCDFNQQLDLPVLPPRGFVGGGGFGDEAAAPAAAEAAAAAAAVAGKAARRSRGHVTVFDIDSLDDLNGWDVHCDNHCFGCTAGARL